MISMSSAKNKTPIKLLIIADRYFPDVVGGGEMSLYWLIKGLQKIGGFAINVIAQSDSVSEVSRENVEGVPVTRVPVIYNVGEKRLPFLNEGVIDKFRLWTSGGDTLSFKKISRTLLSTKHYFFYLLAKTNTGFSSKFALSRK